MKRLVIVADHTLMVNAIRLALRQTAGFEVSGFLDGRHTIRAALAGADTDVVLVDDMQDSGHALGRLREAADTIPSAARLLLTARMDEAWLDQVFEAGADAVLCKTIHPVALGTLVREVVNGTVVHQPRPARPATLGDDCPLTDRELEILRLAAHGRTNSQIARELWVTEQTIKFHLSNTYRKLGVANRTEASRYAHVHDLVADDVLVG